MALDEVGLSLVNNKPNDVADITLSRYVTRGLSEQFKPFDTNIQTGNRVYLE